MFQSSFQYKNVQEILNKSRNSNLHFWSQEGNRLVSKTEKKQLQKQSQRIPLFLSKLKIFPTFIKYVYISIQVWIQ